MSDEQENPTPAEAQATTEQTTTVEQKTEQQQPTPTLFLYQVARQFQQGGATLDILKDINFALWPGELVALVGPSGSGKSTMLQIAGLLEAPTQGEVYVAGQPTSALDDAARTLMRRNHIGFIYQMHHLLPEFTALENVMLPQLIKGLSNAEARQRAGQLLQYLGLAERIHHRPTELSGGEQQRVAIARAVANAPRLLLADEPTGNLDPKTANQVFELFLKLARATRVSALIATHDMALAARLDRRVTVVEGRLVEI